jgi:hypothetical protein
VWEKFAAVSLDVRSSAAGRHAAYIVARMAPPWRVHLQPHAFLFSRREVPSTLVEGEFLYAVKG